MLKKYPNLMYVIESTSALVKFLEDHGYTLNNLNRLKSCRDYLKSDQIILAIQEFKNVPLGGNGTLNDWYPDRLLPNETVEYVMAVFDALVARWKFWMDALIDWEK